MTPMPIPEALARVERLVGDLLGQVDARPMLRERPDVAQHGARYSARRALDVLALTTLRDAHLTAEGDEKGPTP